MAAADDEGWSALHGGIRPSPLVRAWLGVVRVLASGPVARVPPDLLSLAGVLVLVAAWGVALAGAPWTGFVVLLVVAAGVLDGLDGAVALKTGRARPLGAVVDAVADRLGDVLLAAVLVALGAPVGWALAATGAVLLHEYLRARAQAVGMPGVGAVTVAERPTRIILVVVAAAGTAVVPAGIPLLGWDWATALTITWTVVGAVGLGQLLVGVIRSMPAHFPPEGPPPGR